ncbi:hypothetical protein EV641_1022 [Rhodococcus sp. SMB37]|nr:hypothetical protein EV641_1022 [Rhodococcus sp. SMB37]
MTATDLARTQRESTLSEGDGRMAERSVATRLRPYRGRLRPSSSSRSSVPSRVSCRCWQSSNWAARSWLPASSTGAGGGARPADDDFRAVGRAGSIRRGDGTDREHGRRVRAGQLGGHGFRWRGPRSSPIYHCRRRIRRYTPPGGAGTRPGRRGDANGVVSTARAAGCTERRRSADHERRNGPGRPLALPAPRNRTDCSGGGPGPRFRRHPSCRPSRRADT